MLSIVIVTWVALVWVLPAEAVMLFSARGDWQATAGGGTGDIFDDFNDVVVINIFNLNPADRGSYSIEEGGSELDSFIDGILDGLEFDTVVNGTSYFMAHIDGGTPVEDEFTFIFDNPI